MLVTDMILQRVTVTSWELRLTTRRRLCHVMLWAASVDVSLESADENATNVNRCMSTCPTRAAPVCTVYFKRCWCYSF